MFECQSDGQQTAGNLFILMQQKKNSSLMACVYFNNYVCGQA